MCRKWVSKFFRGLAVLLLATTAVQADNIITGSKPYTFIPGTVISSSQVNADFDYIINQVNTNAAKNGANSSITSLLGLTTPIAPGVGGSPIYTATSQGGTANAITITATQPAISSFSLVAGNFVLFTPTASNTAAVTLDVNSTGATALEKQTASGLTALNGGELVTGNPTLAYYDGTQYVLVSQYPIFGTRTDLANTANTADLGTVGSHYANITGGGTITSFGSNGNTGVPFYYVRFGSGTVVDSAAIVDGPSGSTAGVTFAAGDEAIITALTSSTWRLNQVLRRSNIPSLDTVNGLVIINNAGTPTTQIDVDASNAIICASNGYCEKTGTVNLTINCATTGANGLDTGSLANNTWYYLYIISDGATVAGLASTSSTSPTLPSGYVYRYRVGAMRTGGSATFLRIRQNGNEGFYVPVSGSTLTDFPTAASGSTGSAITAVTVKNVTLPATANRYIGTLKQNSSGNTSNVYISNFSGSRVMIMQSPGTDATEQYFELALESNDVFWSSSASGGALRTLGWTDTVNAN